MRRATKVGVIGTILTAGCLLWILALTPRASAIPAFSRKYQTSCATCHSNYPELNDFGEAFKRNGFKFPKDDDSFVKEPPVLLGAKAQKEAFPSAIYPGEIPGTIPISFRYSGNFNYNSKHPVGAPQAVRTDLFVPNTLTIIAAGSFGQNISFWIDNDISAAGSGANGGLGDGYLKFDVGHYLGLPSGAFNVRFGQFEPDLPFSLARTIYPSGYDVFGEAPVPLPVGANQTTTGGNNTFNWTPQRGIEIGGFANNGNFTWSVATDDGTNSCYGLCAGGAPVARNTKDVNARVSYRFNLERDPQSRNAVQAAGPTGPRDHTSIRIGGFYYYGTNETTLGTTTSLPGTFVKDPFYRAGADLRFKYRKMELFGVGMLGHDSNHIVDTSTATTTITAGPAVKYSGGFAGSNFWIYPWMIAYMRYDFVNSTNDFTNGVSQFRTRNRYSPGFQLLVRANVKVIGEYQYRWGVPYTGPTSTSFFRPNTFVTGIDYVF